MARGRSLSFSGTVAAVDAGDVEVAPPARRSLVKVESMVQRRKSMAIPSVAVCEPAARQLNPIETPPGDFQVMKEVGRGSTLQQSYLQQSIRSTLIKRHVSSTEGLLGHSHVRCHDVACQQLETGSLEHIDAKYSCAKLFY